MDTDYKTRKQVSLEQMGGLLEFMQEHPDLAKGLTRGRRGKLHSVKLWNACAKKLNPYKDGACKDGKGWSKYWCDWKYRVRRKALELKAAKDNSRPPPEGIVPLSQMEECILGLIGENAVDGVIIKIDPLAEGETEEEEPELNEVAEDTSVNQCYGTRSKAKRKRRHSSRDLSEAEDRASPPDRKPRLHVNGDQDHSDEDDETSMFLRLERRKIEATERLTEAVISISSEARRLVDVLTQIKNFMVNRPNI
ncbi:uncharacterized protein LOC126381961 [Pectinophora gossypiella]|uniref:uncharacterized protein LOC126381961 n=1 Tax=Pectinophora gossypiella TaxID=13191 RepID=UPI00214E3CF4|nr:uncharacterized protein LOC126381961 [Pectinophora gossypiella]